MSSPGIEFSAVGGRLTAGGGILPLMDDMGRALAGNPLMRMLGGGNPAVVPGMQALVRERMAELLADPAAFERMMVTYDPPRGNPRFLAALADLLRIPTRELYKRLKTRKVLTVPGEHFVYGLDDDWPHRHECLRLNLAGSPDAVRDGYRIIAEEAGRASRD